VKGKCDEDQVHQDTDNHEGSHRHGGIHDRVSRDELEPPLVRDAVAALNAGGCLVRQSYLHTGCGWLALASLITGVVLFILKQRRPSSASQQGTVPAATETSR
jgi:hypothetical protein